MAASEILLITNKGDTTADLLVLAARRYGIALFRINTEDPPETLTSCTPDKDQFIFKHSAGVLAVSKSTSICYRRPSAPETPEDPNIAQWVADQWRDFVLGLEAIDDLRWMSRPSALLRAENKIYQMKIARAVGFKIPATLITNDIHEFVAFKKVYPHLICKALGGGLVGDEQCGMFIYTSSIGDHAVPSAEDLRVAPTIFQENLAPAKHYRITVVGDSAIVVRLTFDESVLDWRTLQAPPKTEAAELPTSITSAAVALVQHAGLTFSSMDVLVRDGDAYFLDLNPNGEWAWLERHADVLIADRIVNYLAGLTCL